MAALRKNPKSWGAVVVAIDRNHDHLLTLMEDLRRRLSGPPCSNEQLASLLRSLVLHLEEHFREEEHAGSSLDRLLAAAPLHTAEIEQLVRDHHKLLTMANDLANRFHQGLWSLERSDELIRRFDQLQQQLADHEMREELLLGALTTQPTIAAANKPYPSSSNSGCTL